MPKHIDFWFDYTCPFAYIASRRAEALAARVGATLSWQPMLLGGVFRARSTPQNLSEVLVEPKARHNENDMERWAKLFGLTLRKPPGHPLRSVEALRATIAVGRDPKVISGFYSAYWEQGRAPSEPDTIRSVVRAAGHDPEVVLARIATDAVKDELRHRTERAIELGIFGAPSFVVDHKALVWGQDRMHFAFGLTQEDVLPPIERHRAEPLPLEVYWDFSSPYAYLGVVQLAALAARTGATILDRPMFLGGLFKTVGQPPVPMATWSQAKVEYMERDLVDWARVHGHPFRWASRFPLNTLRALRAAMTLEPDVLTRFRDRAFRAAWVEDRDLGDVGVLRELLEDAGAVDVEKTLARSTEPDVKQALVDATERAARRGVFGAPTFIVDGGALYWGQDRVPLVERALFA